MPPPLNGKDKIFQEYQQKKNPFHLQKKKKKESPEKELKQPVFTRDKKSSRFPVSRKEGGGGEEEDGQTLWVVLAQER